MGINKAIAVLFLSTISFKSFSAHAPSFPATMMDGSRTTFQELLPKDQLLLISFWATWCIPCLQELTTLTGKLKDQKIALKVITINIDSNDTKSQVRPTVLELKKNSGFNFPVILDPAQTIFSKYQPSSALPFSVLVGPDGRILESFTGYQEGMWAKIENQVAQTFKQVPGSK